MKSTCFDDEDTLVIRLPDKPIVREVSHDWGTHIGYAADASVVETVTCRPPSAVPGRADAARQPQPAAVGAG